MSLNDPQVDLEQADALRNSIRNVPTFKNKMAKEVLKAITSTPVKRD